MLNWTQESEFISMFFQFRIPKVCVVCWALKLTMLLLYCLLVMTKVDVKLAIQIMELSSLRSR